LDIFMIIGIAAGSRPDYLPPNKKPPLPKGSRGQKNNLSKKTTSQHSTTQ
jgi:hypothetical protein